MPIFVNPKENKKINNSNRMLRTISTYPAPAARTGAPGLTRMDATTRPIAKAPAKLARVRANVVRNPAANAGKLWTRTFMTLLRRGGHRRRWGHCRGWGHRRRRGGRDRGVAVDRGRRGG